MACLFISRWFRSREPLQITDVGLILELTWQGFLWTASLARQNGLSKSTFSDRHFQLSKRAFSGKSAPFVLNNEMRRKRSDVKEKYLKRKESWLLWKDRPRKSLDRKLLSLSENAVKLQYHKNLENRTRIENPFFRNEWTSRSKKEYLYRLYFFSLENWTKCGSKSTDLAWHYGEKVSKGRRWYA